jgi:hypothetical protein
MADVERIAPPVPTLPPPIGRNIGEVAASGPRSSHRRGVSRLRTTRNPNVIIHPNT